MQPPRFDLAQVCDQFGSALPASVNERLEPSQQLFVGATI
jgi:hypothetical protein